MTGRLEQDSQQRPELFEWQGPIDVEALGRWLKDRGLLVPSDLQEIWQRTGGGEMFESETLLAPFGDSALGDDVIGVTAFHRARGMPSGYLLFHVGLRLSAIRLQDGAYIVFKPGSFDEESRYGSFEQWYQGLIRDEYAARYGFQD